jgi:predicted ATPase/class 3 adenylate cyclase
VKPVAPSEPDPGRSQILTLVFTDLEGSTKLVQELRDAYPALLDAHHNIVRTAVSEHGGRIEETAGDGVFATFPDPADALSAAVEIQRRHTVHTWTGDSEVRVRIGVHTGRVTRVETGYAGIDLHRAARISAAAWGGQILVSSTTQGLVGDALPAGVGLRDLGEHRLKDLKTSARLFDVVANGLRSDLPPPRTLDAAPRTNLPTQLTSFIGRDGDVQQIVESLDDHRLVTLTGVGGVGKTRLAIEVAAHRLDRHPDGAWLVELAPLTEPDLVVRTIATVLGVREQPEQDLLQTVVGVLEEQSCLILLDNCEHLIDVSAEIVATLLSRCPDVRVLATSREGLGVAGESIRAVRSLHLPANDDDLPTSEIASHESVVLFLDRARGVDPTFHPTADEMRTVAQICRRLDGIPLAIELAASRLRSLDVGHLFERLDGRFRLLAGGSRTALPRQRTLEATLEWSHDLLGDAERILFRRLAVFASGFTIEACETVAADISVPAAEILDLLDGLVDKSLVFIDRSGGRYRYRMLETVRDYARSKLVAAGELERLRDAHAAWVRDLVAAASPHLRGPAQRRWLDTLDEEHAEIRAALGWALDCSDTRTASAIALPLVWFWAKRGTTTESVEWYGKLFELLRGSDEDLLPIHLAIGSAAMPLSEEELPPGFSHEVAVELAREAGTPRDVAVALTNLAPRVGKHDSGEGLHLDSQAVGILRDLGPSPELGDALYNLATGLRLSGDELEARVIAEEAYRNAAEIGELWDVGWSLTLLASLDRNDGDLDSAASRLHEAQDAFTRIGDPFGESWVNGALGIVEFIRGDLDAANALLRSAYDSLRLSGMASVLSDVGVFLARVMRIHSDCEEATRLLSEIATVSDPLIATSVTEEVAALVASEHPIEAVHLFANAASWRERSGHPWQLHWGLHLEPIITELRERMGQRAFESAWSEGQSLDFDDARRLTRVVLAASSGGTPSEHVGSRASPRAP